MSPTVTPAILKQTLNRYSHFGIYDSPAGLINAIGNQVPNLIFASAFGVAQLGQLVLAERLLLLPAGLIASSVGQVFLSQVAEQYRAGTLQQLLRRASRKLLLYGLGAAIVVLFMLAPLIPLLFGQEWEPTKQIIPLLIPLFLGQLVVSPLSNAFTGSQKMRMGLIFQTTLMFIRLAPLFLFAFSASFYFTLTTYSLAAALGYAIYLLSIDRFVAAR